MTIEPERLSPEQLDHVKDVVDDGIFGRTVRMLLAHIAAQDADIAHLQKRPLRTFDQLGADRLADEVAVLVRRRVIDARSPAGDALLDYRKPPSTPRADRLAEIERRLATILKCGYDSTGPEGPEITKALTEAGLLDIVQEQGLAAAITIISTQESRLGAKVRELEVTTCADCHRIAEEDGDILPPACEKHGGVLP